MRFMMLVATDPEGEPYSADEDNIESGVTKSMSAVSGSTAID
jgi:hypothetical protein